MHKPNTIHEVQCGDFIQKIEVKHRDNGHSWRFYDVDDSEWEGPFASEELALDDVKAFADAA